MWKTMLSVNSSRSASFRLVRAVLGFAASSALVEPVGTILRGEGEPPGLVPSPGSKALGSPARVALRGGCLVDALSQTRAAALRACLSEGVGGWWVVLYRE